MPSWQARCFNAYSRLVIRRSSWGDSPAAVAHRARRLFGAPPALQRLVIRGLVHEPVSDPSGVRGEWLSVPGAPTDPAAGVLLYVHGGGYVSGSAATHRTLTAALARTTGLRVFVADYRIGPESPFPAAIDDVVALYRWLQTTGAPGAPIALAGESAGGGLVLLLAQHARDQGWTPPVCVASISPWSDLTVSGESVRGLDGRCHMFRPQNMHDFARAYLGSVPADHPRASPLFAPADRLPPLLLQVGSTELLLDDARRMHERVQAAGGQSRLTLYDDVAHGWHLMAGYVPEADAAVREVADFVRGQLDRAAR